MIPVDHPDHDPIYDVLRSLTSDGGGEARYRDDREGGCRDKNGPFRLERSGAEGAKIL